MSIATIALPSKGRLKEETLKVFSKAGIDVLPPADPRSYRAKVKGRDDIEIAYLSASEIAREVAAGSVDNVERYPELLGQQACHHTGIRISAAASSPRHNIGYCTLRLPVAAGICLDGHNCSNADSC